MHVKSITIYPIKSMGGVSLTRAHAQETGMLNDRRLLLVNEDGRFITQRENQALTRIAVDMQGTQIHLSDKKNEYQKIAFDLSSVSAIRKEVKVWKHEFSANIMNPEISNWIGTVIKQNCELAIMDENSNREKTVAVKPYKTKLSFADGYPYLLLSQSSLDGLNQRLIEALPMNRFRPNLVLTDCGAHEEDFLKDFSIGSASFRFVKKCIRCIVTTTDQDTGEQGQEPLKTLSEYRKVGRQIVFGAYVLCTEEGTIDVGDSIIPN